MIYRPVLAPILYYLLRYIVGLRVKNGREGGACSQVIYRIDWEVSTSSHVTIN